MPFDMRHYITPRYLSAPSKRRSGAQMSPGIRFVVAHDTGNPGSTADQNVAYYERTRNEKPASARLFVDDREIFECIPALTANPEKAWHVRYGLPGDDRMYGADANEAAVGIEYCFGGRIDADAAYDKYVWVAAYTIHRNGLEVTRDIVGHLFLDPDRRTDPVAGLARSRRTYDQFLLDVQAEYRRCAGEGMSDGGDIVRFPPTRTVRTAVRLNLRSGAPALRRPAKKSIRPLRPVRTLPMSVSSVTVNRSTATQSGSRARETSVLERGVSFNSPKAAVWGSKQRRMLL